MKRTISMFIIIALIALCACQPTPENEAVVNKGDGVYEQKLKEAKETQIIIAQQEAEASEHFDEIAPIEVPAYEFEPHWAETVSLRNFNVDIDVVVEAPMTASFPVYRVVASQFTPEDERILTLCNLLMGDVTAMRSGGATVQDLKEQLEQLQLGEYDYETKTWHSYDSNTYKELSEEILQEMQAAPDENDFFSIIEIQVDSFPSEIIYKTSEELLWKLSCTTNAITLSRYLRGIVQPESWVIAGDAIAGETKGTVLSNVSCTEEKARETVKSFFEDVNIGEMDISSMEKGRIVDIDTLEILKEGWVVECARTGGNCSAVNYKYSSTGGSLRYNDVAYSAGLSAESIVLFVDDEGIASFSWSNPLEIVGEEAGNIEILPYKQAQELMRQAMVNGLSWTGDKESGSVFTGVYVRRVALSYCFIPVKDNPGEFYYTPAWFVFMQFYDMPESVSDFVFAINAVDGTRIDLSSVS